MGISAKEAAELVGITKNAIFKAIRTGKISAEKDVNGEWRIQPVELFRVYQPVNDSSRTPPQTSSQQAIAQATTSLQRENELLRDTVADLRVRLDAESEERRRLSMILNETRSAAPPAQAEVDKPKGFWQRLFGR